jgi:hypothetical protein
LGVGVKAPTDTLWVWPQGRYVIGPEDPANPGFPDPGKFGRFKNFLPKP